MPAHNHSVFTRFLNSFFSNIYFCNCKEMNNDLYVFFIFLNMEKSIKQTKLCLRDLCLCFIFILFIVITYVWYTKLMYLYYEIVAGIIGRLKCVWFNEFLMLAISETRLIWLFYGIFECTMNYSNGKCEHCDGKWMEIVWILKLMSLVMIFQCTAMSLFKKREKL